MRLDLKVESEIGLRMDSVILQLQKLAHDYKIHQKDKKTPFRNILAVAMEFSASLESIKGFIKYQIGRANSSPIWKHSLGDKLFATKLAEELNALSKYTNDIINSLENSDAENNDVSEYLKNPQQKAALTKEIHLKLARLYLGYLAREHTALVGENKIMENLRKEKNKHAKPVR
ncbi:hypothetical protein Pse7367_0435 [Thalassoporum mexicanum PCC 7367]|nr:hypothetical protein Pse7367_0435 [Pseudanabaena sp. PCC 7367]